MQLAGNRLPFVLGRHVELALERQFTRHVTQAEHTHPSPLERHLVSMVGMDVNRPAAVARNHPQAKYVLVPLVAVLYPRGERPTVGRTYELGEREAETLRGRPPDHGVKRVVREADLSLFEEHDRVDGLLHQRPQFAVKLFDIPLLGGKRVGVGFQVFEDPRLVEEAQPGELQPGPDRLACRRGYDDIDVVRAELRLHLGGRQTDHPGKNGEADGGQLEVEQRPAVRLRDRRADANALVRQFLRQDLVDRDLPLHEGDAGLDVERPRIVDQAGKGHHVSEGARLSAVVLANQVEKLLPAADNGQDPLEELHDLVPAHPVARLVGIRPVERQTIESRSKVIPRILIDPQHPPEQPTRILAHTFSLSRSASIVPSSRSAHKDVPDTT